MRRCSYNCDYGDGENCHYEGESGCIHNIPVIEKTESEVLEDGILMASGTDSKIVQITSEEAKRIFERLRELETINDVCNVLISHGWVKATGTPRNGEYKKIIPCKNCMSGIKMAGSEKIECHDWNSPCYLQKLDPDWYCPNGERRRNIKGG